ncbi:MAG: hypothetical protein HKM89_00495 [Gemmatimonadales bacterium]|nr:hypothetical protein [Gemmatimonadales bacterium]
MANPVTGRTTLDGRPWVIAAIVVGIAALGLAAEFVAPPDPDNAFFLYAAGRVLDGAKLYVDVVEINPPLIIAFNFPPILIARLIGVSELLVFRIGVACLLGLSILASQVGLRAVFSARDYRLRHYVTVLMAFVLFLLPGEVFSEREHLMLALVLPYLFLAIARQMERPVPVVHAHLVGGLAGFGFALKPQFVLLWVALELWLAASRRTAPRLRAENAWVVCVLAVYAVAALTLTPEYLDVVRQLGGPYLAFLRNSPIVTLLFGEGTRLPLVVLLAYLALLTRLPRPGLVTGLAIAVLGLLLVGTIQGKGWAYHFYPASATALILLGLMVATVTRPLTSLASRVYGVVSYGLVAAVFVSSVVVGAWRVLEPRGPNVEPFPEFWALADLVRDRAEAQPIMVLSYHMRSAWPLVPYAGADWSLRYPSLWILWVLYRDQFTQPEPLVYRPSGTESSLERSFKDAVLSDLEREEPRLIVVLGSARDASGNDARRLDYLAYFSREPRFARQFAFYRYVATLGQHDVYERVAEPAPGPPARPPRHAQGNLERATRPGLRFAFGGPEQRVRFVIFLAAIGVALGTGWHRVRGEA